MKHKINNIQALRAFAAMAVVVFHTGYVVPHMRAFGSFGVGVFFVISGYIMALICATNPSFFLRRRIIRIVPPYWAMTGLLFLCALRFPLLLHSTRASGVELFKSLLFIPYLKPDGTKQPLLFVGWSLNYEMFFYVTIALCLYLVPRRPMLCTSAAIIGVIVLLRPFRQLGTIPSFYSNFIMIDFVLGILTYEIWRRMPVATAFRIRWLSLGTLLASCVGVMVFQGLTTTAFPYSGWIFSFINTTIVLSAVLLSRAGWDTDLAWVVLIGDASYILYLVHPYCEFGLARTLFRRMPSLDIAHPLGCSVAVMLSVLVAILIHVKIERPAVAYLNRRFGRKQPDLTPPDQKVMPLPLAS